MQLQPAAPVAFGNREWVQFKTEGDAQFPFRGWVSVQLTNLSLTLQLAAPEVTSSSLGGALAGSSSLRVAMTDHDRRALVRARNLTVLLKRKPPRRDRLVR